MRGRSPRANGRADFYSHPYIRADTAPQAPGQCSYRTIAVPSCVSTSHPPAPPERNGEGTAAAIVFGATVIGIILMILFCLYVIGQA